MIKRMKAIAPSSGAPFLLEASLIIAKAYWSGIDDMYKGSPTDQAWDIIRTNVKPYNVQYTGCRLHQKFGRKWVL